MKKHIRRMTFEGYIHAKVLEDKKLYGCSELFFYIEVNNRNPQQVQTAIWEKLLDNHLKTFNYN